MEKKYKFLISNVIAMILIVVVGVLCEISEVQTIGVLIGYIAAYLKRDIFDFLKDGHTQGI